ncbi:MAG: hypothetical protein O3B70_00680 [Bacteroidetes bacterium]|nr:hypothetical protein [Bacteroidota bacterium]MDA0902830.1 hypothetical protein [Bacteroidota bacterium]MDA1242017.1 hypothetical protein [Bacteroidota bacterium]
MMNSQLLRGKKRAWIQCLGACWCLVLTPLKGQCQVPIPAPQIPPWCSGNLPCNAHTSTSHDGDVVSGVVHMRLGADQTFDKPLIVVEGLDIGSGWSEANQGYGAITWHDIFGGDPLNMPQGQEFRTFLDQAHALGMDVLFLDFADGTAPLLHQTALLHHVLSLACNAKVGHWPMALVGVSKGGVVGRAALSLLEEQGTPHCVGHFVAIDAPFDGAVIPKGLQALLLGLSSLSEDAQNLWHALQSPAAKQLVCNHLSNDGTYTMWQQWLDAHPAPRHSSNLNILNSRNNVGADLTDEPLLGMTWGWTPTLPSPFFVQVNRWDASQAGNVAPVAGFQLPGDLNPWTSTPPLANAAMLGNVDDIDLENAPGSESTHLSLLLSTLLNTMPLPLIASQAQSQVTFVPHDHAWGDMQWSGFSLPLASQPRETHASLGSHHRQWLLNQLSALWWVPESVNPNNVMTSNHTWGWNAPLRRSIRPMTLAEGTIMNVGNTPEIFAAQTTPCQGELRLRPTSALNIGNTLTGAKGSLDVLPGSTLVLDSGSVVVVAQGSKLVLRDGATLRMEGGQIVVENGGTIAVESGGQIDVLNDALVMLEGPLSAFDLAGHWNVHPGAHVTISCDGQWTWLDGSSCWIGYLGTWEINLEENAHLSMEGQVITSGDGWMTVSDGHMTLAEGSGVEFHAPLKLNSVWLEGHGENSPAFSIQSVWLTHCDVGNVVWHHDGDPGQPKSWKWSHCEVAHSTLNLTTTSAQISGCTFRDSHVKTSQSALPFLILDNVFDNHWTTDAASLWVSDSDIAVQCQGNVWTGGDGVTLEHGTAIFGCNTWEGCDVALHVEGPTCQTCLSPACGGGYNQLRENQINFSMACAPLPLVGFGENHFGEGSVWMASGTTCNDDQTWWVQGNSWSSTLLDNPWSSPLAAEVQQCQSWESVDVWMSDPVALASCDGDPPSDRPIKKTRATTGLESILGWNVLGQEVPWRGSEPPVHWMATK